MNRSTKRLLSNLTLLLAACAAPAGAASGDTVADRVLGQRRLSTSLPYFVDGRVFGAVYGVTDVAVDRSVTPNRVYLADTDLNRVLGWSDIQQFRAGASADLVLGQPSLFTGQLIDSPQTCPQPPSATSFCRPSRVEVDPAGNLYVADSFNYRVLEFDRPFTTDRTADLVFGQPDFNSRRPEGFGAAGPSVFDYGPELVVDAAGNLWIADPGGSRRIFEFDAPPAHGTVADRIIEPRPSSQCGTAQTTSFCYPAAIGISPAGDLYVRDSESGPTQAGPLLIYRQPLTTDLQPDLVVTYPTPLRDMVFDPAGNLLYFYGSYSFRIPAAPGPGTIPETVRQVHGYFDDARMAMDSQGNLYVASSSNRGFVDIFDGPNQKELPRVGRAHLTNQGLQRPVALAVDRSSTPNHLYVLDQAQRLLGWRDAEGFANGAPADLVMADPAPCNLGHLCLVNPGIFTNNLAVDSKGNLWVSSTGNFQILEFDRPFETDLIPDRKLGKAGCTPATRSAQTLCYPGALTFDRDDNLYVADLDSHRVLLFKDPLHDGTADKVFGQPNFQAGSCNRGDLSHARAAGLCFGLEDGFPSTYFYGAGGVAVDAQGNLYVADSLNFRVLIFKDAARSDTLPDAVLGQDGSFRTRLNGTGAKRFGGVTHDSFSIFGPTGLAIGPGGELYVADPSNDRLLVFKDPLRDDVADRVFGHPSFDAAGTASAELGNNPPATAARLLRPTALAFDAQGNLYVADTFYNRVLVFDRP